MNMNRTMAIMAIILFSAASAVAEDTATPKRTLKANRLVVYNVVPPDVETFTDLFKKGEFYGRVRINTFGYDWKGDSAAYKDNWVTAIGGSLTYKTAYFKGFGGMVDVYTSQNPWHMDQDDLKFLKSGKDALSRYDAYTDGDYYMNVIAQAYGEFKFQKSSLKYGRQKLETMLTRSNDTKMIPNTFEGFSLFSNDLDKTLVKLAWMTRQKLRDHTSFHDVLTYGDDYTSGKTSTEKMLIGWSNNDDSAMHRGLSYENYKNAGEDTNHDLLIAEVQTKAVKNLKLVLNYTGVPDVISLAAIESHYTIPVGSYKIIPGFRYLYQFDDGGGDIGGASLTGLLADGTQDGGYDDSQSLDSWLIAARVDLKSDAPWAFRLGYSHIGDEADIVAPWRGFPTGGFTRAMGQYNWYANTDTYMLRGSYDFNKAGIVPGLTTMFRLCYQDYDEDKKILRSGIEVGLVPTDRTVLHLDFIQQIKALPGLEARLRMVFTDADDSANGTEYSYNEYRFELNYLF
jgi:hypothetical protein